MSLYPNPFAHRFGATRPMLHPFALPTCGLDCQAASSTSPLRSWRMVWVFLLLLPLSLAVFTVPTSLAQEPAAAEAAPAVKSESMLLTTWKALGWKYALAFLIMSFLLVAVLVMVILAVRKDSFLPADLSQGVEASLADNNLQ
ncbi:MAG: hypothetical protein ACK56I_32725, partial [bacterium]